MSAQTLAVHSTGLRLRRGNSVQYTPHLQLTSSRPSRDSYRRRLYLLRSFCRPRTVIGVFILISTLAFILAFTWTLSIVLSWRSQTSPPPKPAPQHPILPLGETGNHSTRPSKHEGHLRTHKRPLHKWRKKFVKKATHRVSERSNVARPLDKLPDTHWWTIKSLANFKPRFSSMNDIHLVTLENACYCTERGKFILPMIGGKRRKHFPTFMRRHGIAKHVRWRSLHSLLWRPTQNVTQIPGTTILWRGRDLNEHHTHLVPSLIPIRAVADELKRGGYGGQLNLAAERFTASKHPDSNAAKLHEYFIGDLARHHRVSLHDHRPNLLCFQRVISLGTEFEGHSTAASHAHTKDLIHVAEKGHLPARLVKKCQESVANKGTLWIIDRQATHSASGSISNMVEVITAVNHALISSGLAELLQIKVIQGPNVTCPPGTSSEGCVETDCVNGGAECSRRNDPVHQVKTFNNMTALITVAGPALEGMPFMPAGSSLLEVIPFGTKASSVETEIAHGAGIKLHRIMNRRDDTLEQALMRRFGDVATSPHSCWMDSECREARLGAETNVEVHHLQKLLRVVLREWQKSCRVN